MIELNEVIDATAHVEQKPYDDNWCEAARESVSSEWLRKK